MNLYIRCLFLAGVGAVSCATPSVVAREYCSLTVEVVTPNGKRPEAQVEVREKNGRRIEKEQVPGHDLAFCDLGILPVTVIVGLKECEVVVSDVYLRWGDPRYTSNTVFDSYPWPQSPNAKQVVDVAKAAENLRTERRAMVEKHGQPLRDLYRTLELPGKHPLKKLQIELDKAVASAYGTTLHSNPLTLLMEMNESLSAKEHKSEQIIGPGLPKVHGLQSDLVSSGCVQPEKL